MVLVFLRNLVVVNFKNQTNVAIEIMTDKCAESVAHRYFAAGGLIIVSSYLQGAERWIVTEAEFCFAKRRSFVFWFFGCSRCWCRCRRYHSLSWYGLRCRLCS